MSITVYLDERIECLLNLLKESPSALCIWAPLVSQESNAEIQKIGGIIKIPAVPNSAEGGQQQALIIAGLLKDLTIDPVSSLILSDGLKTIQAKGCMGRVCPYVSRDYSSVELLLERERLIRKMTGASYRHITCG